MKSISLNRSNRIGLSLIFFLHGIVSGLWFTQIPAVQAKLGISNTELSIALIVSSLGSFPGLAAAAVIVPKFGTKKTIAVMISAFICMLTAVLSAPTYPLFLLAIGVFGFVIGAGDVALNSRASMIENQYGTSIMSSFHAFWSISGLIAAGIAKLAFSAGLSGNQFIPAVSVLLFGLALTGFYLMKPYESSVEIVPKKEKKGPVIVFPRGSLVTVSVIVVLAFISEGAVYDWGTLYLHKVRELDVGTAALGFGGFSFLMAVGRVFGDRITRKIGHKRSVTLSSIAAAASMSAAVLAPSSTVSLICIALTGIGMANIVPVLFSMAGNSRDMDSVSGIASVTMVGYGAFMFGPPLMGLAADHVSLSLTMFCIMLFSLSIAVLAGFFLKDSGFRTGCAESHDPIERF